MRWISTHYLWMKVEMRYMISLFLILLLLADAHNIQLFDSWSQRALQWDIEWCSWITHFDIQEIFLSPFVNDIFLVVVFESLIKSLLKFGNRLNWTHLSGSNLFLLFIRFTIDQKVLFITFSYLLRTWYFYHCFFF
jgi:hypothetical protein